MAGSFVQQVGSHTQTTASFVITVGTGASGFSGTTTAGNRLVIGAELGSGGTISSIADSKGNTWAIDQQGSSGAVNSAIASSLLTTPLVTGDTITLTQSASVACHAGVIEITGVAGVDQTANHHATTTTTCTVATTVNSAASDFAVAVVATSASSAITATASDPDSGGTWTDAAFPAATTQCDMAYQAGPATTTLFSETFTAVTSGTMDATLVSYKVASSGTNASAGNAAATGGALGEDSAGGLAAKVQINMTINGV